MRLVFAGTPAVAVPALQALLESTHDVVAVVTRPDAQRGRGRQLSASPVADLAHEHGIPVLTPERASDPAFLATLAELHPDCCPVVAYGALLPPAALAIPPHGWVNLHFSLLPRWRGAAPVQHALLAGDAETGACVFRIEEGLDTGPVIACMRTGVEAGDTTGSLLHRLARAGAPLLVAALDAIADGSAVLTPQSPDGITLAPKLGTEDARIDWTLDATSVDQRIRAVTPVPGAWTLARQDRLKLGPVLVTAERDLAPGSLAIGKREVRAGTGSFDVVLSTVQAPGRPAMPAADWARGLREPIASLG